jgi:hypothetical protein
MAAAPFECEDFLGGGQAGVGAGGHRRRLEGSGGAIDPGGRLAFGAAAPGGDRAGGGFDLVDRKHSGGQ